MSELSCKEFDELAPELALGVLAGNERAAALSHLAGCPQCREELDGLVRVGDSLLLLAPAAEPPIGFETRVMARLTAVGAVPPMPSPSGDLATADDLAPSDKLAPSETSAPSGVPGPATTGSSDHAGPPPAITPMAPQGTGDGRPAVGAHRPGGRPGSRGGRRPGGQAGSYPRRWLATGIAAALVVIAGLTGLLVGHDGTTRTPAAVRAAVVKADDGKSICRVLAFAGQGGTPTVLAIHLDESGDASATYPVLAQPANGGRGVDIGTIAVRNGQGSLLATVPAGTGRVSGITVVWPDGSLRYRATFAPV